MQKKKKKKKAFPEIRKPTGILPINQSDVKRSPTLTVWATHIFCDYNVLLLIIPMRQCGPVTLEDASEVFLVKASLVVWVFIAFAQGSIIPDKARNKGRFARKRSLKYSIAMLTIE